MLLLKILFFPTSFLIFLAWAITNVLLSLFVSWIKVDPLKSPNRLVDESDTVCKLLWGKSLITREDYQFELDIVSAHYRYHVFWGYQHLVSPLIYIMKRTCFFDEMIHFFVKHWIKVQKTLLESKGESDAFSRFLASFGVGLAASTGRALVTLFGLPDVYHQYKNLEKNADGQETEP